MLTRALVQVLRNERRYLCQQTSAGWLCGACGRSIIEGVSPHHPPDAGAACPTCGAVTVDSVCLCALCGVRLEGAESEVSGVCFGCLRRARDHREIMREVREG